MTANATPALKLTPSEDTSKEWKFSEILEDPAIARRWEKVRRWFFLRESTYDMTNRCNIRCEGCYYYEGEKQLARENRDPHQWRELMQAEKERGITFVVLAGAEPSLVPELCQVCYDEIPLGAIATNGLKPIPPSIDYQIHISVWGSDAYSREIRGAQDMLVRQLEIYGDDPRAVFVYTVTPQNIDGIEPVTDILARHGARFTFNMFSAPVGYRGSLAHTSKSLMRTRQAMTAVLERHPQNLLFSTANIVAHTHRLGLHALYGCTYPRMNPSTNVGLGRSFRQYHTDLRWNRDSSCCVPDTDCADCRHYAAGSAVVTARLFRHASRPETFKAWLDYVDTYLSVWVREYEKSPNLSANLVAPPGCELF